MMARVRIIILTLLLVLVLMPTVALGADYEPAEEITLAVAVIDASGDPVTDATITVTVYDSDGNVEVNAQSAGHIAGGVYGYDWTFPAGEDSYYAVFDVTGYKTVYQEYHVVTPPSVGAVWGEDLTTYTDPDTAGGLLNTNLGGEIMLLVGLIIFAVVLTAIFFVTRNSIAGIIGGAGLFLVGVQSYTMRTASWDVYGGLAFFGMFAGVLLVIYAIVTRERPQKGVVEYDEVTGDPVQEEGEKKVPRTRRAKFSR